MSGCALRLSDLGERIGDSQRWRECAPRPAPSRVRPAAASPVPKRHKCMAAVPERRIPGDLVLHPLSSTRWLGGRTELHGSPGQSFARHLQEVGRCYRFFTRACNGVDISVRCWLVGPPVPSMPSGSHRSMQMGLAAITVPASPAGGVRRNKCAGSVDRLGPHRQQALPWTGRARNAEEAPFSVRYTRVV